MNDFRLTQQTGEPWLERFAFVNIRASLTSYAIGRLTPGEEYAFIVASVSAGGDITWPQHWAFLTTTATAAHSNDGICPITGLPIGDGYVEIGETADWFGYKLTIDSATIWEGGEYTPVNVNGAETYDLTPPPGRRYLRLNITIRNDSRHSPVSFSPGYQYTIDTDAGTAFTEHGGRRITGQNWTWRTDLLWEIPESATVAVLAARPLYSSINADRNTPTLFRVPIPQ